MTIEVETRSVTRTYRNGEVTVEALRGVDLTVTTGDFVAIMGPSGSGKSTLLHLLAGLDTPTMGDIRLAGRSLGGLSRRELATVRNRTIGIVFQFFNLVSSLTAWENVALPAVIDGRREGTYRPRVEELLEVVGLADKADRYPASLSGGEQQRIAIARALSLQPAVLLADEPTGNLDTRSAAGVLDLLRAQRDQCQTIILVTHDAKVGAQADRLITMRDGEITADESLRAEEEPRLGDVVQVGDGIRAPRA